MNQENSKLAKYHEFNKTMQPNKWEAFLLIISIFIGVLADDLNAETTYKLCDIVFSAVIIYITIWSINATIELIIKAIKQHKQKKKENK